MQAVSTNVGYGFSKAISTDNRAIVFRSIGALEQGALNFETELNKPERANGANALDLRDRGLFVEFGGERWALGRAAFENGRMGVMDMGRARLEDSAYRLMYAATLAATVRHSDELVVVASLPLRWYNSDREKARAILSGTFQIKYRGVNRTYKISPENCHIIPEGFGALCSKVLTPDGKVANAELARSVLGSVDIGTRTVGALKVDNLRVIPTESDMTEDLGMYQVWKMLQEEISSRYGREFNYREIDEIMHARGFYDGEVWIDLTDEIDRACQALAKGISNFLNGLWDGGRAVRWIIPSGGGAQFTKRFFTYKNLYGDVDPEVGQPDYSFFDNAAGGLNFALARRLINA